MQPINHMDDIEEEFKLALKLKNLFFDASATETESEKAAEIYSSNWSRLPKTKPGQNRAS